MAIKKPGKSFQTKEEVVPQNVEPIPIRKTKKPINIKKQEVKDPIPTMLDDDPTGKSTLDQAKKYAMNFDKDPSLYQAHQLALKQLIGGDFSMYKSEEAIPPDVLDRVTQSFKKNIDAGEIDPETGLFHFTRERFPEEFAEMDARLGGETVSDEVGKELYTELRNDPTGASFVKKAQDVGAYNPLKINQEAAMEALGFEPPPTEFEMRQEMFDNSLLGNSMKEIQESVRLNEIRKGADEYAANLDATQASEIMNSQLGMNTTPEGLTKLLSEWNEQGFDADKTGTTTQDKEGVLAGIQRFLPGGATGTEDVASVSYADLIKKFGEARTYGEGQQNYDDDGKPIGDVTSKIDLQKMYSDVVDPQPVPEMPPIKPETPIATEEVVDEQPPISDAEWKLPEEPPYNPDKDGDGVLSEEEKKADDLYQQGEKAKLEGVANLYRETLAEDPYGTKARTNPILDFMSDDSDALPVELKDELKNIQSKGQGNIQSQMEATIQQLTDESLDPTANILDITRGISEVRDKGQNVNEASVEPLLTEALESDMVTQLPLDVVDKLPEDLKKEYINRESNVVGQIEEAKEEQLPEITGTGPDAPKWWQMGKQIGDVFAGGDPEKMSSQYTQDVTDPTTGEVTQEITANEGWGAKLGQFISSPAGQRYMGEMAKVASVPVGGDKSWQGALANMAIDQAKGRSGNIDDMASNQQIISQFNPGENTYSTSEGVDEYDEMMDGTIIKDKNNVA